MIDFTLPDPIRDTRELKLLTTLTDDYRRFCAPGPISKVIKHTQSAIAKITPAKFKQLLADATKLSVDAMGAASEHAVIKQALEAAGKGFGVIGSQTAKLLVISSEQVLLDLSKDGHKVPSYEHVCALRSYWIDKAATSRNYQHRFLACAEGAITGAPGLIGIPFNIAFSFLLFFRATQSVAMHYGYDVKTNASELETAAQITLECLAPGTAEGEDSFAGLIGNPALHLGLERQEPRLTQRRDFRCVGHLHDRHRSALAQDGRYSGFDRTKRVRPLATPGMAEYLQKLPSSRHTENSGSQKIVTRGVNRRKLSLAKMNLGARGRIEADLL